jgi:DNA-binding MarR family transcriptional regulator
VGGADAPGCLALEHHLSGGVGLNTLVDQGQPAGGTPRRAPLRAGELAQAMRLDPSTLSRNLQPLLDRGLVDAATGDDARSVIVSANAAGVAQRHETQEA